VLWLVVMAMLALLLPANAAAHGRGPTVAIDDRLVLAHGVPGLTVRILDGDRSLHVSVAPGHEVVIHGYLDEPMLRFADGVVTANRASPTATADRVVTAGSGWVQVAHGREFAWHDHRLAPPPGGGHGAVGRWTVPVTIDGKRATIAGTFWRVAHPDLAPWLLGALAAAGAVALLSLRAPQARGRLALALAVVAAAAALAAIAAFALRDAPTGNVQWLQLVGGGIVAVAAAAVLVRTRGTRQTAAAGVIGALAAAAMLSALPVFRHGVVISALPATAARILCAAALVGGAGAAAVSLFAQPVRRIAR
jgi:hypothetical protein